MARIFTPDPRIAVWQLEAKRGNATMRELTTERFFDAVARVEILGAVLLIATSIYPNNSYAKDVDQARAPAPNEANLRKQVIALGKLLSPSGPGVDSGAIQLRAKCKPTEHPPACTTFAMFSVGGILGNSVTQYLALFEPVAADQVFPTLPPVVQAHIHLRPWVLRSVIPIGGGVSPPFSAKGMRLKGNEIILTGLGYQADDPDCCPSKKISATIRIINGVLVPVSPKFFNNFYR
ncbi:MAG TPA: hypothetical protein VFK24_03050 [Gammaproteobacteria bacterium]|nr:hypothetical protein [Gammaproteobacteria bacterium]